ncbi:HAD family hydrolase [Candidatus Woesearchaeota archaeon]|nr:HAD family hydrolase [Candidatus Woesearchaeota archaeon]
MKTRLVIFDCDGVIIDSFGVIADIYDELTKKHNIKKPEGKEFYRDFFELDWRKTLRKLNINTEEGMARAVGIFEDLVKKNYHKFRPFKGIDKVLGKLHEKYRLAIVSNNQKQNFIPKLKEYSLHDYFDLILGIDDGEFKPSPDLLLKCMDKLDCLPGETVFVGDMEGDIQAGKAAKVKKVIAVTYGFHTISRLKKADILVNTPEEIIEAVK